MPELSELGDVIKPAYEGESNTNAFTDAEKSKLAGIEAGAQANDVPTTWANISGKPAVVAEGADAAAARTSIGAGTGNSNLAIGTTGTTAAAGDHTHADLSAAIAGLTARVEALESAEG